jgi:hypothetical protein
MLSIEFSCNFLPVGKDFTIPAANFLPVGNGVVNSVARVTKRQLSQRHLTQGWFGRLRPSRPTSRYLLRQPASQMV